MLGFPYFVILAWKSVVTPGHWSRGAFSLLVLGGSMLLELKFPIIFEME